MNLELCNTMQPIKMKKIIDSKNSISGAGAQNKLNEWFSKNVRNSVFVQRSMSDLEVLIQNEDSAAEQHASDFTEIMSRLGLVEASLPENIK